MNVAAEKMEELVKLEYEAAQAAHGPLASMHEGWAVALEELEETEQELREVRERLDMAWAWIKHDSPWFAAEAMEGVMRHAVRCACEAVQVAAVCKRFADLSKVQDVRG